MKIAPQYFFPRKGDALIWVANLLHGGSRQRDPHATRWSQVTHYFFENCCYITPMYSDVPIGKLHVRNLVDIATGAAVPDIYIDAKLSVINGTEPSRAARLGRLLRHPVRSAKKSVAMLRGPAAS